jgi:hypothetical protein
MLLRDLSIIIVLAGCEDHAVAKVEPPPRATSIEYRGPFVETDIDTFAIEWARDAANTELKYKNKAIKVTGPVYYVGGTSDAVAINLGNSRLSVRFECDMPLSDSNKSAADALSSGDIITVQGLFVGAKDANTVYARDCTIAQR